MDLCTGSGCIPLLFQHEFAKARRRDVQVRALGVDISKRALGLAQHNLKLVQRVWSENGQIAVTAGNGSNSGGSGATPDGLGILEMRFCTQSRPPRRSIAEFIRADVLVNPVEAESLDPPSLQAALNFDNMPPFWDILISNPPYISPAAYWKTTSRSVRHFEPKRALVPPNKRGVPAEAQGDMFYPRILTIAQKLEVKVVLLEVADLDQALRVGRFAGDMGAFGGVEIWRDAPDLPPTTEGECIDGFNVIGQGNARSVVCWRGRGAEWLGKERPHTDPSSRHSV
jgi:hypothetical protein